MSRFIETRQQCCLLKRIPLAFSTPLGRLEGSTQALLLTGSTPPFPSGRVGGRGTNFTNTSKMTHNSLEGIQVLRHDTYDVTAKCVCALLSLHRDLDPSALELQTALT
jgi:hypothetical protein